MQPKFTGAVEKLQARMRLTPHVRLIADLLGLTPEFASDRSLPRRLTILAELNHALEVEVIRGNAAACGEPIGWNYDPSREVRLRKAITDEVKSIQDDLPGMSTGDLLITQAVLTQIAA
jgi:hypothetical protein